MAKTQGEIEKARMGEDDACADESCRIEEAANAAMDEGARKVREEQAYHSFAKSERAKESRASAEREEREERARELKERMESEKGERLKARVKSNFKSGVRAVGESIVGGAREAAVKAVTPQKSGGYLPQSRGGFVFPQLGGPVSFSPKQKKQGKGKKNTVPAKITTGKRGFSTGIRMQPGSPIGTGMSFVPPAVPRFGSPATPKSNFGMPFPKSTIQPPKFGESHFGKSVPKREFTRDMRLGVDFNTSPFGKQKTNPLKGKRGGL